jgi:hypothetical protein
MNSIDNELLSIGEKLDFMNLAIGRGELLAIGAQETG